MSKTEETFPSPFDIETPEGAEGWEELYPNYLLFSEDRRSSEEKFWFADTMHWPQPLAPFDVISAEYAIHALSQFNTRIFAIPTALGIDMRILNGYVYLSPVPVTDPAQIQHRLALFQDRSRYYFDNWDELYAKWKTKVVAEIEALTALEVPALPDIEEREVVTSAVGISTGFKLLESYDRIVQSVGTIWQYHFELLNLGYVAYLDLSMYLKQLFPDIEDQTITQLLSGVDVILFRPDEELKRLAELAHENHLDPLFFNRSSPDEILDELRTTEDGRAWIEELEGALHPWFNFCSGTGFHHTDRSWVDDLSVPFSALKGYLQLLESGQEIRRPLEEIRRKRDDLEERYRSLLLSDEEREQFDGKIALAKKVFPYIEEHNFYIEHWHHTIFWNKMRELGAVFASNGFFESEDDVFYLKRYEIHEALYDLYSSWAVGTEARGVTLWPAVVAKRRRILEALWEAQTPPALGTPPEDITEPFTIMLWGIVSESIANWLEVSSSGLSAGMAINGHAASPGKVEGVARVVLSVEELDDVEDGEIVVCPIIAPSWAPFFPRMAAVVTNVGGMMSHACILCREYQIPAVVGTGFATQIIQSGQRIRIDGSAGTVEILD